jgi:hypothetical protein
MLQMKVKTEHFYIVILVYVSAGVHFIKSLLPQLCTLPLYFTALFCTQVGAYAHSMVEFGCNHALARQFVRRLAATYQLASDQLEMLLAIVG